VNLLDDTFDLAKDGCGASGDLEAKGRLQSKYPTVKWDDALESYLKARALAKVCYDFGEQCGEKDLTDEEVIGELRRRFPVFSEATYRAALSHGSFLSR